MSSVCVTAVAAGVYAIGAAALAAAAASGGSLIIAGFLIGPEVLGCTGGRLGRRGHSQCVYMLK